MIDNYKDLLYAIVKSDQENGDSIICVYDTFDSDKLCIIFNNLTTCAKFFNTSRSAISTTISKGTLRCKRYRIERFKIDD